MVNRGSIKESFQALGIEAGDTILVHSSFKSLGEVDGGAESVIAGILDVIGPSGTLVMPTFIQKNFEKAYDTWYMDKPSDTGYLTEYLRMRHGSRRSDQATHSVAATGKDAEQLTKTHGHTHKRFGNFGDTPFSADSPWEKMYINNAKTVLLGVDPLCITFRHYAEYVYMEHLLFSLSKFEEYEEMKAQLWRFWKPGVWPHVCNTWAVQQLDLAGEIQRSYCGDAALIAFSSKTFVDFVLDKLAVKDDRILWRLDNVWNTDAWIEWRDKCEKIIY